MSGVISATTTAVVMAFDALNAIESVNKMYQVRERGSDSLLETASVVDRLILLGFTIAQVGMLLKGTKSESLALLKSIELLPRVVNVPIQFSIEANAADNNTSFIGLVRLVNKGLIAPIADCVRVASEAEGYHEKAYLENFQTDPSAQRPVYEWEEDMEGGHLKLVGYRPIDPKECEANIQTAQSVATVATGVRAGAELGTYIVEETGPLYERLARFLGVSPTPPRSNHATQAQNDQQGSEEEIDLLALPRIPIPLHGDPVFRKYWCPITNEPIRDPVRDPNGRTLYERRAIYNWLGDQTRPSPVTRQPMRIANLQEVPAVRASIDARLGQHQQHLLRYLQRAASRLPINQQLDASAEREHPTT